MLEEKTIIEEWICKVCNSRSPKEIYLCMECGRWYTFEKNKKQLIKPSTNFLKSRQSISISKVEVTEKTRIKTDFDDFDRCVGGGMVVGSVMLLSGFPGSGKSTLAMQVCSEVAKKGYKVHYVTGEESRVQIKLRADRLKASHDNIFLLADQNLRNIFQEIDKHDSKFVVIDSLQEMYVGKHGNLYQQTEATKQIVNFAKKKDVTILVIGHITKDGEIAGPEHVQHAIDAILKMEGEKASSYRVLKVHKNRFGSEIETGMFQMKEEGLIGVNNPAVMFLIDRDEGIVGSVLTTTMMGNRCTLAEIQAHLSCAGGNKITCVGVDKDRVNLIVSILAKHRMIEREGELFITTTGGVKCDEVANDLAIALAILSSYEQAPVNQETVVFGELGLSGDIRGVSFDEHRIKQIEKVGFENIVLPQVNALSNKDITKCNLHGIRKVTSCVDFLDKENKAEDDIST